MKIRLVLTGRSYHRAAELPETLDLPEGASVQTALDRVNAALPADAALPASCLIAVDGKHLGSVGKFEDAPLSDGQELTLVAPVAGG